MQLSDEFFRKDFLFFCQFPGVVIIVEFRFFAELGAPAGKPFPGPAWESFFIAFPGEPVYYPLRQPLGGFPNPEMVISHDVVQGSALSVCEL